MAGVSVTIPGVAGIIERRQALMSQAVAQSYNLVITAAAAEQKVRRPSAGDLGRPLQNGWTGVTCRLTV